MSAYDHVARLYDLEHRYFRDDVELYLNIAERCRSPGGTAPVLELGCGTGRVCVPLAQAGFDVVGVDHSAAMLDLARAHVADAGLAGQTSRGQVCLEHLDVREIKWSERFALALYPLNGFLHLKTITDQSTALRNVYRALLPGGFFLVDLPNPHTVFSPVADGQLCVRRHFRSEQGYPIASLISTQTDLAEQIQHLTLFYDEVGMNGTLHRTAVEMELRFLYRFEMAGLLEKTGFEVDAVYGSYDLEPYQGDSPVMLFSAHKPL